MVEKGQAARVACGLIRARLVALSSTFSATRATVPHTTHHGSRHC